MPARRRSRRPAARGGSREGDPGTAAAGLDEDGSRPRTGGRSPAPGRRPAAPAATAPAAGRHARSRAMSASPGRRSGPRARRTRRSRRRCASTAGIIASSEPPVVRMSSTRRTRSPGAIVKPRRNSRRGGRRPRATSSAKIARVPSCRPVSKARITPPVVGPATRSTSGRPSASRCAAAQNAAQLARRGRILQHLELLQVGVRVAAALEREVAVTQGTAGPEQGLRPGGAARRPASSRVRRRVVTVAGILAVPPPQAVSASSSDSQPAR